MGKKYVHDLSYCSDLLTLVVKSKDHGALSRFQQRHVTKLKSSQAGFLNITMIFLDSNGLCSAPHRALLRCCTSMLMWGYHVNMGQNLWWMFPAHPELGQPWRQKGIRPSSGKVYLNFWWVYVPNFMAIHVILGKISLEKSDGPISKAIHSKCDRLVAHPLACFANSYQSARTLMFGN